MVVGVAHPATGDDRAGGNVAAWLAAPVAAPLTTELPIPQDPLIGRERELAEIASLLSGGVRLITLTGPGGVGKTRLALAAAVTVGTDFDDGVRFVPLGAMADPSLVGAAIAQAAGARPQTRPRAIVPVPRSILLVIDTFEHVLSAAPVLADLLAANPALVAIVTSRSRLRLRGEQEYPISPLALDAGSPDVAAGAAVRLFVSRAAAVRPGFAVDAGNTQTISAICNRLDGLPLAIELAAAWLRMLSPQALLDRLSDPLPLLAGGSRDVPDRQKTLRATIASSFGLLTDHERRVAAWFAGFSGGATIEMAEAVCAQVDAQAGEPVLTTLARLVEQSVLQRADGPDGETRLTMLQTVRDYARELLRASGDDVAARSAHATAFHELVNRAADQLKGPEQRQWQERLDADLDNLRQALDWYGEHEIERGLTMAASLWLFWHGRGYLSEGRTRIERFLASPLVLDGDLTANPPAQLALVRGLTASGALAQAQGDHVAAVASLHRAIEFMSEPVEGPWLAVRAWATLYLGLVGFAEERLADARSAADQAVADARGSDEPWVCAVAQTLLGLVSLREHDYAAARAHLDEAAAAFRGIGNGWGNAIITGVLGVTELDEQNIPAALPLLIEALVALRDGGDLWGVATFLDPVGRAATGLDDMETGAMLLATSQRLHEISGSAVLQTYRAGFASNRDRAHAVLGGERFDEVWATGRAMSPVAAVALAQRLGQRVERGDPILPASDIRAAGPPDISSMTPGTGTAESPISALSPREMDVLRLVAEGRTGREIADTLFISVRTAETHVGRILRKLDVPTRSAAAALAGRHGLGR